MIPVHFPPIKPMPSKRIAILTLGAIVVLASLLVWALPSAPLPAVVWLTPDEFAQKMTPPRPKLLTRMLRPIRHFLSRGSLRHQLLLATSHDPEIQTQLANLPDLPAITNHGWRALIVPAAHWNSLLPQLTSAPPAIATFRPLRLPGVASGGGSGSISSSHQMLHYVYDFRGEPVPGGLKITLSYRSDVAGQTNQLAPFTATIPAGGAVLLQKIDDQPPTNGLTLLTATVFSPP